MLFVIVLLIAFINIFGVTDFLPEFIMSTPWEFCCIEFKPQIVCEWLYMSIGMLVLCFLDDIPLIKRTVA